MLMQITDIMVEEIKLRAFDIYEFRQDYNIPGDALSDWLQAQKEILDWYNPNKHVEMFQPLFGIKKEAK